MLSFSDIIDDYHQAVLNDEQHIVFNLIGIDPQAKQYKTLFKTREETIESIKILYQKWWNALPAEEQTQDKSEALAKNAGETTFWIIQEFMNRFNAEASNLKTPIDDSANN